MGRILIFFVVLFATWALDLPAQLPEDAAAAAPEDRLSFFFSIVVPEGAEIADTVCIACSVYVEGKVSGEVVAVFGDVIVDGEIGSEVVAAGGSVRLGPGSRIGDEVVAVGGTVVRDPTARIDGAVEQVDFLFFPGQRSFPFRGTLLFAGGFLAAMLLGALILRWERLERMGSTAGRTPLRVILVGAVLLTLLTLARGWTEYAGAWENWATLAVLTLIVLPAWLGSTGLAQLLGGRVIPAAGSRWKSYGLGTAILLGLLLIPVAGLFAMLGLLTLGLGLSVISRLGAGPALAQTTAPDDPSQGLVESRPPLDDPLER